MQGRPAEHRLEEREENQEDSEHDAEHHDESDGSGGQTTIGEEGHVDEWLAMAALPRDEGENRRDSDQETRDREWMAPTLLGSFVNSKNDASESERRQDRAHEVERVVARLA